MAGSLSAGAIGCLPEDPHIQELEQNEMEARLGEARGDDSADRVGTFSHSINRNDLRPGDHIYAYRALGLYQHHGIYVGEEGMEVIHFSNVSGKWATNNPQTKVHSCTLDQFLGGSAVRLAAYGVSRRANWLKRKGTCHLRLSQLADDVVCTAKYFCQYPEECMKYSLWKNNCEHFATLCKTGVASSKQSDPSNAALISVLPPNALLKSRVNVPPTIAE